MRILLSLALATSVAQVVADDSLPRLELGAGLSVLSTPDYRGAESSSNYLIPIPYIKYRGDRLRVDEGAKGILVERPNLELSLSANFAFPVDDDIDEREGMDELDAIIEIGPSLNYRFYPLSGSAWWLDLPLRLAYTASSDFDSLGYVFQPRLTWRKPSTRLGETKLRFNFGPVFASEAYHEYFYSVAPSEVRPGREAYDAEGGFSGFRSEFTYSRRIGTYWLGAFLRYDSLRNAEIEDSPLVFESDSWIVGIGLAWVFRQE